MPPERVPSVMDGPRAEYRPIPPEEMLAARDTLWQLVCNLDRQKKSVSATMTGAAIGWVIRALETGVARVAK